jgi:poly-gamma-glutamate synthesis protein (capsule biosynthesis protein)
MEEAYPNGGNSRRHSGFRPILILTGLLVISALFSSVVIRDPLGDNSYATPEAIQIIQPNTEIDQGEEINILLVGDVMLGRGVADLEDPFKNVAEVLVRADLTVGNFEGVIHDPDSDLSGLKDQNTPWYRIAAPEKAASQLQAAGFDLVSLANNHSLDFGTAGLVESVEKLRRSGIRTVGVGPSQDKAYQPALFHISGVRIAIFGINAIVFPEDAALDNGEMKGGWEIASWEPSLVQEAIRQKRQNADVIIVFIHWGDEYELRAGLSQKDAALQMIEAGADLVVGAHPHTVQEMQVFETPTNKKGFTAYSLGNFVFDQFEERTREGLALQVSVDRAGVRSVKAIPVLSGPKPGWRDRAEELTMIDRVRPEPKWIGFHCQGESCWEVPAKVSTQRGLFTSGQLDLNGDGELEVIRLIDNRLMIFEGNKLAWESPPEWQIIDVALGDPNNDGRGEALLALKKPDRKGELLSHPFLVGHRGGIYRLIWGGSAVADPIQELELADLDSDGRQELIVIDDIDENLSTVTVWRWDEWYFRQVWRSQPGRYRDLQITTSTGSEKSILVGQEW